MNLEDRIANLLDDPDFHVISRRFGRFNLFEAIGGVRRELGHSNFLAFLFSPNRSHGLGSAPLRHFLRKAVEAIPQNLRPIRPLDIIVADLEDAIVHRERSNIDLLIELRELRLVVVVENKVGADAYDGQLQKYVEITRRDYADWKQLYVFLTPDGRDPEHESYAALSYTEIAKIVDEIVETEGPGDEVLLVLKHYNEMLRVHVVEDERLKEIALRIYDRHQEALNFIFNARPEPESKLPLIRELAAKECSLALDVQVNSIARFFPHAWEAEPVFNACPPDQWTKTGRNLIFEVKSFKTDTYGFSDRLLLSLILGPADRSLREYLFEAARADRAIFAGSGTTVGKSWTTLFSKELLSKTAGQGMDESQKVAAITSAWATFIAQELPRLVDAMTQIAIKAPKP